MSKQYTSWKDALADRIPPSVADDIDLFERQLELRKAGKLDERVFAELRLRRGAYGQRYDNGRRYDGVRTQDIAFPRRGLTKGPDTELDAPGMQRIKIPFGKLSAEQLEVLADCAEEYSNGILHVTTRQDVQLHFVDIEDTPDMHRRLAGVGITTREACGNSVRNVTGCPYAGICRHETFDISPYADAETRFLLGHRDVQDFGRKFKIAFSGCEQDTLGCGRVMMHDLGFVAAVRTVAGREERGFRVVLGGGLGPVPHVAKELYDFLPAAEMLPISQAIARVYARLGEKKNRNKARIKFLVAQRGIEGLRRLVDAERAALGPDPAWTALAIEDTEREFLPAGFTDGSTIPAHGFDAWCRTNVYLPRQDGFVAALVNLPLGDLTAPQARKLADVVRTYTAGGVRTTADQNILLRSIHAADLAAVYNDLRDANLALDGATTIADVTTCPGTDTCKLGIASSRGLGAELRQRLHARGLQFDPVVKDVHVRVSGCPNSCGLHHVGDIGFYGSSRNVGAYKVPHFQVLLGGALENNAANYGLAIGAVPSKRAPETVDRLLGYYAEERAPGESFRGWVTRVGKKSIKDRLQDLLEVPAHDEDPSFYVDWHDDREYTIGDIGVGECAGEVVSLTQFGLATAESRVFDASLVVDDATATDAAVLEAARVAYGAIVTAAQGLVKSRNPDIPFDPDAVFDAFRTHFVDTGLFFGRFVGTAEWQYYQSAHEARGRARDRDEARRRVEEAQLFIEAVHACYSRLAPGAA